MGADRRNEASDDHVKAIFQKKRKLTTIIRLGRNTCVREGAIQLGIEETQIELEQIRKERARAIQQAQEAVQREQVVSVERDAAIVEKKEKEVILTQAAAEVERLKTLLAQQDQS